MVENPTVSWPVLVEPACGHLCWGQWCGHLICTSFNKYEDLKFTRFIKFSVGSLRSLPVLLADHFACFLRARLLAHQRSVKQVDRRLGGRLVSSVLLQMWTSEYVQSFFRNLQYYMNVQCYWFSGKMSNSRIKLSVCFTSVLFVQVIKVIPGEQRFIRLWFKWHLSLCAHL